MAKPYSPEEIRLIRQHYPDYPAMLFLMPTRTRKGLEARAQESGIAVRRRPWTVPEVRRLAELCQRRMTWKEIKAAFPNRTMASLKAFVQHHELSYQRAFVQALAPEVHAVRQRAAAAGMSFKELDRLAQSGAFFQNARWRSPALKHVAAGAHALGGEIRIEWEPLD